MLRSPIGICDSLHTLDRGLRDVCLSPMYGVPADLPIQPFVGQDLNQICLGRFQIQLHFSGAGSISVEGRWEIRDAVDNLVDSAEPHENRESYRIHRLIDVPVARFSIDPPRSFTLVFDNGLALTVFDDSEQYESFSIKVDGFRLSGRHELAAPMLRARSVIV